MPSLLREDYLFKKILPSLLLLAAPLTAIAEESAYCSGPTCSNAVTDIAQTSSVPAIPPEIMQSFWLVFMIRDYAENNPDLVVSTDTFSSQTVMVLEYHDIVNLLLFYDPHTFNVGLVPSDIDPNAATPFGDPELPVWDVDPNEDPYDFRFMTTADYVGNLERMLDDLMVRYPDQTVSADSITADATMNFSMRDVANTLIFLDPYLDNLGWSPSVFETE
jgi:hypothetical protein